jgi:hypothetical protein
VNGFLFVTPFTRLQSPDDSPVQINVYIRGGEDIQFNNIDVARLPTIRKQVETKAESEDLSTNSTSCFDLNEKTLDSTHKSSLHFGEQPASFRSYLRRYFTTLKAEMTNRLFGPFTMSSYIVPNNANPWNTAGGNLMDLYSYLSYAYLGRRGGVNKRLWAQGLQQNPGDHCKVYQQVLTLSAPTPTWVNSGTGIVSHTGTATFVPFTNAGVEVNIPFYSSQLWFPAGIGTNAQLAALTQSTWDPLQAYNYSATFYVSDPPAARTERIFEETSFADDFVLLHFLAAVPYATANY